MLNPRNAVKIVDDSRMKPYGEPYRGNTSLTPTYKTKDISPVAKRTRAGPSKSIKVRNPKSISPCKLSKYFFDGDFGAVCVHGKERLALEVNVQKSVVKTGSARSKRTAVSVP